MIASLRGILRASDAQSVILECAGVGYRVAVTARTLAALPPAGEEAFLYTHLSIRENLIELYGFRDTAELTCFKLLTSVSNVGGKIGLALLSDFTADQIALCIASGDAKTLTRASGVGSKLAQRIVLELKDKLGASGLSSDGAVLEAVGNATASGNTAEAITALVTLGFSQSEASLAVGRLDPCAPVEQLIKDALKSLAR